MGSFITLLLLVNYMYFSELETGSRKETGVDLT